MSKYDSFTRRSPNLMDSMSICPIILKDKREDDTQHLRNMERQNHKLEQLTAFFFTLIQNSF